MIRELIARAQGRSPKRPSVRAAFLAGHPQPSFWRRLFGAASALALAAAAGCAGPVPAQTRVSLLTWYAPKITVYADPCATNASGAALASRDSDSMSVRPSLRGVCLFVDNQFALPNGGGTASSNSVLSGIEIPLVK